MYWTLINFPLKYIFNLTYHIWRWGGGSACAKHGAGHYSYYSYKSGPGTSHHLAPSQSPSELTVKQGAGRWRCRPYELQTTGIKLGHYWLAVGHCLPSSLLPQWIDNAVGGRTVSSFFLFPPCPTFSALPQATPTDVLLSYQTTFAINCCLHGRSVILGLT